MDAVAAADVRPCSLGLPRQDAIERRAIHDRRGDARASTATLRPSAPRNRAAPRTVRIVSLGRSSSSKASMPRSPVQ